MHNFIVYISTLKGLLTLFTCFAFLASSNASKLEDQRPQSRWPLLFSREPPSSMGSHVPPQSLTYPRGFSAKELGYQGESSEYRKFPEPHRDNSPSRDIPSWKKRGIIRKRRGRCMNDGEVCLFRSALVGGVMKLPCCPGSTCTLMGSRFTCVNDEEMYAKFGEGNEPEVINLDEEELAGLGDVLGGRRRKR